MPDSVLTPPSEYSPLRAVLISALVLAVVGVAVFFLNPRKTAELKVTHEDLFAPHIKYAAMTGDGAHVVGAAEQGEDDLYVVATVRLENKLRLPIFPNSWAATMITPEDTVAEATPVSPQEYPRLLQSFPQLAPMLTHPIASDAKAAPGKTIEGTVLLLFPNVTADLWKKKKSAALTLTLAHQDPQTAVLP